MSDAERKKFVEFVLDQYMGDIRLALWLGEQIFGKPRPNLPEDENGKLVPVVVTVPEAVAAAFNLHGPDTETAGGNTQ